MDFVLLALAGFVASVLNALAGGGAFITIPVLLLAGLDARAANLTSIVALFPGQLVIAWTARHSAVDTFGSSLQPLILVSLLGGFIGALLLLATPSSLFTGIVPWLIAFSTLIYAAEPSIAPHLPVGHAARTSLSLLAMTLAIGIYGGYFGGGVGFIAIALLTLAGASPRGAGATKNVLAAAFNATAVLAYCLSSDLDAARAVALAAGGLAGGFAGGRLALRLPEPLLRRIVVLLGAALTGWLLLRRQEASLS